MQLPLVLLAIGVISVSNGLKMDICTANGSVKPAPDCHMPTDNITKPLYPKAFSVEAPGYINLAIMDKKYTIQLRSDDLKHYLDTDMDTLKYDGRFDLLGPLKFRYNMTHHGKTLYNQLVLPRLCVCNGLAVGIFKYDAFIDAQYKGRETIDVEYGVGERLTDHYLKEPGHNLWMDVETKLPVRFFQAGMGLSVYKGWTIGSPGPEIMSVPKSCFNVGGCTPPQIRINENEFVSPLDYLPAMLSEHMGNA